MAEVMKRYQRASVFVVLDTSYITLLAMFLSIELPAQVSGPRLASIKFVQYQTHAKVHQLLKMREFARRFGADQCLR